MIPKLVANEHSFKPEQTEETEMMNKFPASVPFVPSCLETAGSNAFDGSKSWSQARRHSRETIFGRLVSGGSSWVSADTVS
ncbi:MAG TPA: hypothetical protein VIT91_10590 [Chthoniobacterales bacterium]